jgi:hypothetical protein
VGRVGASCVVGCAVGLLLACSRSQPATPEFDCRAAIERVRSTQTRLVQARERLEGVRRGAGPGGGQTGGAALKPGDDAQARADFEARYREAQAQLAGFLTEALSSCPQAPETAEALTFYSDEAVRHARFVLASGGSRAQARAVLRMAAGLYAGTRRAPPARLAAMLGDLESGDESTATATTGPPPRPGPAT